MFQKRLLTTLETISLQKKLPLKGKSCDIFLIVHFGLQVNATGHSPPGYTIDYKFGFDFCFWAKLI